MILVLAKTKNKSAMLSAVSGSLHNSASGAIFTTKRDEKCNQLISQNAYAKYRLYWTMRHEYDLNGLIDALYEYSAESDGEESFSERYAQREKDAGFSGLIRSCCDEFLHTKFQNENI